MPSRKKKRKKKKESTRRTLVLLAWLVRIEQNKVKATRLV